MGPTHSRTRQWSAIVHRQLMRARRPERPRIPVLGRPRNWGGSRRIDRLHARMDLLHACHPPPSGASYRICADPPLHGGRDVATHLRSTVLAWARALIRPSDLPGVAAVLIRNRSLARTLVAERADDLSGRIRLRGNVAPSSRRRTRRGWNEIALETVDGINSYIREGAS